MLAWRVVATVLPVSCEDARAARGSLSLSVLQLLVDLSGKCFPPCACHSCAHSPVSWSTHWLLPLLHWLQSFSLFLPCPCLDCLSSFPHSPFSILFNFTPSFSQTCQTQPFIYITIASDTKSPLPPRISTSPHAFIDDFCITRSTSHSPFPNVFVSPPRATMNPE